LDFIKFICSVCRACANDYTVFAPLLDSVRPKKKLNRSLPSISYGDEDADFAGVDEKGILLDSMKVWVYVSYFVLFSILILLF
jgi:hypothetical protein